ACWVLGKVDMTMPVTKRWCYRGAAAVLVLGAGVLIYGWGYTKPPYEVPWRTWSPERVETAVRSGNTVLVDFTAAWCTVCKANKKLAFNTREVGDKIESLSVIPFQGDFTSGNDGIAAELRKHGRAGVPLNLIYPAGKPDDPIVLQTNLNKRYLLQKLDEAGPSPHPSPDARPSP
ncbi:MAG: thioredoxin family protein, partial [Phycisphaerae bacterium]